jgi:hypothetical protein
MRDSEPWVSMLAELMKTFPGTGTGTLQKSIAKRLLFILSLDAKNSFKYREVP